MTYLPGTPSVLGKLLLTVLLGCGLSLASVLCPVVGEAATSPGQSLRSGAEVDYPPFSFVDENGRASGFSVELLRAALEAMDREVTFRTGDWAEVRGWLERGEIDALPLVGRTPEREALFDFTVPYMSLHGSIVVRQDQTGIHNLGDLRGRRVAVMKADNAEEFLRREDRGIDIHTTPTFETALRELAEGRYDAVVAQRLVALRLIQKTGLTELRVIDRPIEGFKQDFCFAVQEGDRETLALLNEGLAIVVADGTHRHLHAKWFAAMQLPSDRPLVVGGDRNFPPYEYLDENGDPVGYNVDLTRAIAREMGLNFEIRLGRWTERLQALESGKIDVMQGMFYSPARDLTFDFSQPHAVSHYVAVVRQGDEPAPGSVEELAGKGIAVQRGDILHDFALENGLAEELVVVADQEEALRELSEGKHDCALVSRVTALYLIEKHGWSNLIPGKEAILASEYCYAVSKGRKALLAQFSEGLKALENSGEYRRIQDKWLGVYKDETTTLTDALRYSAIIVIPLLLVLLASFAWSWSLRRQVADKTRALQESLDRFKSMFEAVNVGKSITLPSGEVNANKAFADFLGYTPDELKGKRWQDLTPPEDVEATERVIGSLLRGEKDAERFEKRYVHKNGALLWADVSVAMRRDDKGKPLYFMTTVVDITEKKSTEEALRQSEEYQRAMIACSPVALYTIDPEGKVLSWNASAERIFGWSAGEVIGRPLPIVPPDKQEEFRTLRQSVIKGDGFYGKELMRLKKDGRQVPISLSVAPVKNDRGEIVGILSAAEDITERRQAQLHIEHLNQVLRAIRDINQLIVRERDRDTLIREGCRLLVANRGYPSAMIVLTDKEDRPIAWAMEGPAAVSNGLTTMLEQGELPPCCVHAREQNDMLLVDDRSAVCSSCPLAVFCAESQSLCAPLIHGTETFGYVAAAAEKQLIVDEEERSLFREMAGDFAYALSVMKIEAERGKLQFQLLQAQKMESVGRLAGGVAHDYNNMLGVISGYAELALVKIAPDDPLQADLQEILSAARRSADITRQLLAFARQQTIDPRVLDLNETVESMLKMLRRLIGEDIDLSWEPGPGLWSVKMDPSQLDQILANLCVNARDAISDVGKITIETDNIHLDEAYCADHAGFIPGDFVRLAVSDDGRGMDKETLDYIFEPFFTTKDLGQGTGLGLATVYGIVKQNHGFINVYSEPGQGTTFRIYLPRYAEANTQVEADVPGKIPAANAETVLIVEDEPSILKLAKTMLQQLGYSVLETTSPKEALHLAKKHSGEIHLLISDVVMPEMNGRDLAEKLQTDYPKLKVLFMSGYTANVIAHRGVLDAGVHFIQKPFSSRELAVKAREALEG
ncbi:MAG: transporter substrate-binding domain-containing protein [Desulfohalobiaceae bacterium]|nr:transporter substrate-binding domain-containing protein [Desulfohalobiaceae bacterium]